MKATFIFLGIAVWGYCAAQNGTGEPAEKWKGEIITTETKLGRVSYQYVNAAVTMDVFLMKYTDQQTGELDTGISLSAVTSNITVPLGGVIWARDLDKFIRTLQFISDSLTPKKPVEKMVYSNNLLSPDIVLRAEYDPYNLKKWVISLCFGSTPDEWVMLDNNDCKKLIGILQEGKRRL